MNSYCILLQIVHSIASFMDRRGHRKRRLLRQTKSNDVIRYLYRGIDGFSTSLDYRKGISLKSQETSTLTYGEIDPKSFPQILQLIEKSDGYKPSHPIRKFVDLGCGTGKACICAALSPGDTFQHILGIDIVSNLIEKAIEVRDELILQINELGKRLQPSGTTKLSTKAPLKADVELALSDVECSRHVADAFMESDTSEIAIDALANKICLRVGHKVFKATTKKQRGFNTWLRSKNFVSITGDNLVKLEFIPECQHDEDVLCLNREQKLAKNLSDIIQNDEDLRALTPLPRITYEVGDIFTTEWWTDADVVYAASLLFSEDMMERLTQQVMEMKTNSWFITLRSLTITTDERKQKIHLFHESFFKMSWEMANVFIYRIQ